MHKNNDITYLYVHNFYVNINQTLCILCVIVGYEGLKKAFKVP